MGGGGAVGDLLRYQMWQRGNQVMIVTWVSTPNQPTRPVLMFLLKTHTPLPAGPNWGGINLSEAAGTSQAELYEHAADKVWAVYKVNHEPFSESLTIMSRPYRLKAGRVFLLDFTLPPIQLDEGPRLKIAQIKTDVPAIQGTAYEDFQKAASRLASEHEAVKQFLQDGLR